jgi:hypothetical protein
MENEKSNDAGQEQKAGTYPQGESRGDNRPPGEIRCRGHGPVKIPGVPPAHQDGYENTQTVVGPDFISAATPGLEMKKSPEDQQKKRQ